MFTCGPSLEVHSIFHIYIRVYLLLLHFIHLQPSLHSIVHDIQNLDILTLDCNLLRVPAPRTRRPPPSCWIGRYRRLRSGGTSWSLIVYRPSNLWWVVHQLIYSILLGVVSFCRIDQSTHQVIFVAQEPVEVWKVFRFNRRFSRSLTNWAHSLEVSNIILMIRSFPL